MNGTQNRKTHAGQGFTLLEIVIALALFALIAVPAVGLAVMATRKNAETISAGEASELKNRLDVAMRAMIDLNDATDGSVLKWGLDDANPVSFLASRDLRFIERLGGTISDGNDGYYLVEIEDPIKTQGPTYSGSETSPETYRLIYYRISWPNNDATATAKKQIFATSVFRK